MKFTFLEPQDLKKIMPLINDEFSYACLDLSDLKSRFNSKRFIFFKVVKGSKIVGFLETEILHHGIARINGFAVFKPYRRKGYGQYLLKNAINVLSNLGLNEIILLVRSDNKEAKSLYKKLGFSFKNLDKEKNIEMHSLYLNQYSFAT